MGEKLHTPVKVYATAAEVTHSDAAEQARRRGSKGWFDPNTGEIGIVLENNRDVDDVKATICHETVAHHGLRELIGEERYNEFLDEVYRHLNDELKRRVDDAAGRCSRRRRKELMMFTIMVEMWNILTLRANGKQCVCILRHPK